MPHTINGTTGEVPASWTTAGRPSSPVAGQTGFNTTLLTLEVYSGSVWEPLVTTNDTGTVTPTMLSQKLTQMTSLAYNWNGLTTNTVLDFTGIPSWAKRVTVQLAGVSTNSTGTLVVQIGSGSFATSGYVSGSARAVVTTVSGGTATAGFHLNASGATNLIHGHFILSNITGNQWVSSHMLGETGSGGMVCGGGWITLGGVLDRVRLTTTGGTDTFDAGTVNVMYEG